MWKAPVKTGARQWVQVPHEIRSSDPLSPDSQAKRRHARVGRNAAQCLAQMRDWKQRGLRPLRRRGQKDRTSWERISRLAERWLPIPRIQHPYPAQRPGVWNPR